MATPSSTRYFTSSFVAMLVVVAIIDFCPFVLNRKIPRNFLARVSCCNSACKDRFRFCAGRQHSVKKQTDDGGGQFVGVRIYSRLVPFVSPVHHPEKAEDSDAGMDPRSEAVGGNGVEDFAGKCVVSPLDGLDLFAIRVAQRIFLMG